MGDIIGVFGVFCMQLEFLVYPAYRPSYDRFSESTHFLPHFSVSLGSFHQDNIKQSQQNAT